MRSFFILTIVFIIGIGGWLFLQKTPFEYSFIPDKEESRTQGMKPGTIRLLSSDSEAGTTKQIEFGRHEFFSNTFGNEIFFTDILGMFDGPLTFKNMTKAILKLNGEGTQNLQVEADHDFKAGSFQIKKGELINTGLDVAKGGKTPVGVKISYVEGQVKAGISCAVCHASVDTKGRVLEGVANSDLNIGPVLAMGTNSASYFTHSEIENLKQFIRNSERTVESSKGKKEALPDPKALEDFVDSEFVKWIPGGNDTTIDLKNNPVQIPDAFTLGDHPYGWSGQGQIGPFKGLSAAINNVHAQNMDALSSSVISDSRMNIDEEVYLGTVLQNAANPKYRYNPKSNQKPSDFFSKVDPTPGVPGVNELIKSPTYPKSSFMTTIGLFTSAPKHKAWEQLNAMSAYMNSLKPAKTGLVFNTERFDEGRTVFEKAGCIKCHAGEFLTSNKLINVEEIKTDPSRAKGFKKTEKNFSHPKLYSADTEVPLPQNPKVYDVPMSKKQEQSLKVGWAHGKSNGAYKTISLYGLYWSAPYLHDGGVAVGDDSDLVGLPNTMMKGVKANPANSLRAVVDSNLRRKVIDANLSSRDLLTSNVSGKGHEFWVDESTGFTKEQQDALIYYLLRITDAGGQQSNVKK